MERPNPPEPGVHPGLPDHVPVEGHAEEEEGLRLLAGAASARTGSGAGGAGAGGGGEPEGRPGPFGGIVTEPEDPEEGTSGGGGRQKRKRDEDEAMDPDRFLKELTLSLMSKRRPETVWWSDLEKEFHQGEMHLLYKYGFEQVKTHWLEAWEDWEMAFNMFAKVALRPDTVYTITKTVDIRKPVYVIGNGAVVRFQTTDRVAFNCCMQNLGPGVINLNGVTFCNVRFAGDGFNGTVFAATTQITLHGVFFQHVGGACVDTWAKACVRGCTFVGCWKAVVGRPKSVLSVKKCVFERCLMAMVVEGQGRIRHNAGSENVSFLLLKGTANVKHNMICGVGHSQLLTCADGNCQALRTVHVVSHRRRPWPVFEHNMLMRCTMHLGCRRGVFVPHQCNLTHTKVLLETDAFSRVNLNGVFDLTMEMYKVVRYDESKTRCRPCECGANHLRMYPVTLNVTEELRPDHQMLSCLRTDYESSDED
ncbi:E1B 55K [Simian adenovirus 17]|uniref:E1B 55 kDa protein n=1 Tax=Simian adenovirus 17 TaxID=1715779 RepID=A0A2H4CK03_9ADEN|nr:E1B 55K [Simian adenovirus 17]